MASTKILVWIKIKNGIYQNIGLDQNKEWRRPDIGLDQTKEWRLPKYWFGSK